MQLVVFEFYLSLNLWDSRRLAILNFMKEFQLWEGEWGTGPKIQTLQHIDTVDIADTVLGKGEEGRGDLLLRQ